MPRKRGPRTIQTDDGALTIEALRIATQSLLQTADDAELVWPTSPLVERLRLFAQQMTDLREKLETQ